VEVSVAGKLYCGLDGGRKCVAVADYALSVIVFEHLVGRVQKSLFHLMEAASARGLVALLTSR
jgi:hypothetical protein